VRLKTKKKERAAEKKVMDEDGKDEKEHTPYELTGIQCKKKKTYSSPIKSAPSVNATARPDSGLSPDHGSADDAAMAD
jgi:hypothetical protein